MMEFVTLADIHDDILEVDEADVDEANRFVLDTAVRLGVAEESLLSPPRFIVRRLAVAFACYNRCLRAIGSDGSVIFNGQENADIFAQKLAFYRSEVRSIEPRLTVSDFIAEKREQGRTTIELWRA